MKILFFGDIVGKGGRRAIANIAPELKKEFSPDITIANVENIAHGVGVTRATLDDIRSAGIDAFTSGNHIWAKEEAFTLLDDPSIHLVRPHNIPQGPGSGFKIIPVGPYQLLLVNLQGQVFMGEGVNNPFSVAEDILKTPEAKQAHGIIVDFHGEATSEKVAFGWFLDGRVSAVVGTHTHVATNDQRILLQGTAYVSDIGMCGPRDSVIGVDKDVIVKSFVTGRKQRHEIPESGDMTVNAVIITLDPKSKKATEIVRVDRIVHIE